MYQLHVNQKTSTGDGGSPVAMDDDVDVVTKDARGDEDCILKLDHYEGLIPSCSNRVVELSVQPKHQLLYNCTISYSLRGKS